MAVPTKDIALLLLLISIGCYISYGNNGNFTQFITYMYLVVFNVIITCLLRYQLMLKTYRLVKIYNFDLPSTCECYIRWLIINIYSTYLIHS